MRKLEEINIKVIDHKDQRYPSCGDYFYDENGVLQIRVSRMSNNKYALLLAAHEFIEAICCTVDGVTPEMVDEHDFKFEENDANRTTKGGDEPGDEPDAPYADQHCLATAVERMLAYAWGVKWKVYDDELYALPYPEHWVAPKKKIKEEEEDK